MRLTIPLVVTFIQIFQVWGNAPGALPKDPKLAALALKLLEAEKNSFVDASERVFRIEGKETNQSLNSGSGGKPNGFQTFSVPQNEKKLSIAEIREKLRAAKSIKKYHSKMKTRDLQGCTSFEESPTDPSDFLDVISSPWDPSRAWTCKMFVAYGSSNYVCSGSLVGPLHFITARHCTVDGCRGQATTIRVMCGYGYLSGADDYAHYGSAFGISSIFYTTYDNNLGCSNGDETGNQFEYDIQLIRLDRRVGDTVGFSGATADQATSVNVQGYPGNSALNTFISQATSKMFFRFTSANYHADDTVSLPSAWVFGGESGCPYYRFDSQEQARYVIAVHNGGPTGCTEYGRQLTQEWVDVILDTRGLSQNPEFSVWTASNHCQIVQYHTDIHDGYSGPLKGVGSSVPQFTSTTIDEGSTYLTRLTLYNVGNMDTGEVSIDWYADDTLVGTSTITNIASYSQFRTDVTMPAASWIGTRTITATWSSTSCETDSLVPNEAEVGIVTSVASPVSPGSPVPSPTVTPVAAPGAPVPPGTPTSSSPTSPTSPTSPPSLPPSESSVLVPVIGGVVGVVCAGVVAALLFMRSRSNTNGGNQSNPVKYMLNMPGTQAMDVPGSNYTGPPQGSHYINASETPYMNTPGTQYSNTPGLYHMNTQGTHPNYLNQPEL